MQEEGSSKTLGRILLGICGGVGLGKLKMLAVLLSIILSLPDQVSPYSPYRFSRQHYDVTPFPTFQRRANNSTISFIY